MKKLVSLLLTLVMLCTACAALGEGGDGFVAALADWGKTLNLAENDYESTVTLEGMPVFDATLRQSDGITELKLGELATVQYVDNQLVIQFLDQVYTMDVQSIKAAAQSRRINLETLKEDKKIFEGLYLKAALYLLAPYITSVDETGALVIHVEADQDDLMARITDLFNYMEPDEESIDKLLKDFGVYAKIGKPGLPITFAELKALWETKVKDPSFKLPPVHLDLDMAISLKEDGSVEIGGLASVVTQKAEADMIVTGKTEGGVTAVNIGVTGSLDGKPFDDTLQLYQDASTISLTCTEIRDTRTDYALSVSTNPEDFMLVMSCNADDIQKDWAISLTGSYHQESGDLFASLDLTAFNGLELVEKNLATLAVQSTPDKLQAQLILENAELDVLYLNSTLYQRVEATLITGTYRYVADTWLFPIAEGTYRFRSDVKQFDGILCGDHIHASGIYSSDSLDMTVTSDTYGKLMSVQCTEQDENFALDMEYYLLRAGRKSRNPLVLHALRDGNTFVMNTSFKEEEEAFSLDFTAELDEQQCPQFLNAVLILEKPDDPAQNRIIQLNYTPDKVTLIDGQNYYELEKTEDSAEGLTFVLTRNRTTELLRAGYRFEADGGLSYFQSGLDMPAVVSTVRPLEKTEIEPIDTTDAIELTPEMIVEMISAFTQAQGDVMLIPAE